MDESLNRERPVVRLRAFRAIDDPIACELFIEGHTHVLTSIGVTKVTSSRHEWTRNPAAFVIIVESLDGKKVYGGARVHVAGGTEALPIEQATIGLDSSAPVTGRTAICCKSANSPNADRLEKNATADLLKTNFIPISLFGAFTGRR